MGGTVRNNTLIELVAGGFSGSAGLVVGHPMDTIKVILQNSSQKMGAKELITEVKHMGNTAFFRGLSVPFLSYFALNAVCFSSYKWALYRLNANTSDYGAVLAAGAFSGFCQLAIAVPVDVVKIRLQKEAHLVRSEDNPGPFRVTHRIIRREGIRSLYSGIGTQAFREIPSNPVYFLVYQWCLDCLHQHGKGFSFFTSCCVAGAAGGLACWLSILPIDVMKTRIQSGQAANWRDATRQLYREDGVRAFFKGGIFLSLRAVLVNAVTFIVYEYSLMALYPTPHSLLN